jgi:hypothetical protein
MSASMSAMLRKRRYFKSNGRCVPVEFERRVSRQILPLPSRHRHRLFRAQHPTRSEPVAFAALTKPEIALIELRVPVPKYCDLPKLNLDLQNLSSND